MRNYSFLQQKGLKTVKMRSFSTKLENKPFRKRFPKIKYGD